MAAPIPTSGGAARLVRALPAREVELLADFLRRNAGANAFLLGWLDLHGTGDPFDGRFHFVGSYTRDGLIRGEIEAAALVAGGDICCVSDGVPAAATAIGEHLAAGGSSMKTLAGPSAMVDRILEFPVGCTSEPTILRQRVYVLRAEDLVPHNAPLLRIALPDDIPALTDAGLQMHAEEVGAPLSEQRERNFRRAVGLKVDHQRSWVLRDPYTDELVFKASLSSACADVAQLEGVWVAPSHRRRGVGRACVAELCARLLERHALVSLYVGLDNAGARDLYRKLGFRASTPFSSVLYDARREG